jgi:hypothetical protein
MKARRTRWARHVHIKAGAMKGWCAQCPAAKRHSALRSVAKSDGYGVTVRRLNFLANVANRRSNPKLRIVARRDVLWARRHLASTAAK